MQSVSQATLLASQVLDTRHIDLAGAQTGPGHTSHDRGVGADTKKAPNWSFDTDFLQLLVAGVNPERPFVTMSSYFVQFIAIKPRVCDLRHEILSTYEQRKHS